MVSDKKMGSARIDPIDGQVIEAAAMLRRRGLAAAVFVPNVVLLILVCLALLISRADEERILPLVRGDARTLARLDELERHMLLRPSAQAAVSLARAYSQVGQRPWSYSALQSAERRLAKSADWRLQLGMAYVEIGQNRDGYRVLSELVGVCRKGNCPKDVVARLDIFLRVTEILMERGIDASRQRDAAVRVLRKVAKRVDLKGWAELRTSSTR